MRVVFVGSGTGGHFYPLIAIAEAIRAQDAAAGRDSDLYFIGPDPYDTETLTTQGIKFVNCPAGKRRVYRSILNFLDIFKTGYGVLVAFVKLLWLYPDAVMSKGGYTSVPVVLAAWLLRIPVILHESDAVAGRANLFAARFATYIGIAHADAASYFPKEKVAHIGMPIRRSFFVQNPNPHVTLGIPSDKPVIFVTGGSLGAQRLNDLVLASLDELLPNYTIVHQAGTAHAENVSRSASSLITDPALQARYFVLGRMGSEQMSAAQDAAQLIVSRAGSGSIFEIALKGKPSILIPIPESVSRDQRANAYAYARTGAATVIEEHNLSDDLLVSEITRILTDTATYQSMQTAARNFTKADAADTLAGVLMNIAADHE